MLFYIVHYSVPMPAPGAVQSTPGRPRHCSTTYLEFFEKQSTMTGKARLVNQYSFTHISASLCLQPFTQRGGLEQRTLEYTARSSTIRATSNRTYLQHCPLVTNTLLTLLVSNWEHFQHFLFCTNNISTPPSKRQATSTMLLPRPGNISNTTPIPAFRWDNLQCLDSGISPDYSHYSDAHVALGFTAIKRLI